ncbi:ABC transporter substrate-binding protein [Inquilinus limosus]|uniref:ABC transporter substrate-binding protein n=1 Tax=Inquilinus limosus TaxID=171674 RepID=UPI0004006221|nr:ABC transporter substrate-binding protein [Inquilinus limosus]
MTDHRTASTAPVSPISGCGTVSRRKLLRAAAAAGAIVPFALPGGRALAQGAAPRRLKLAWSQTAVCQSPISVALKRDFFGKYGLEVEHIQFSGPTDQLLEAIATGHADGGIGMALRWLKPLEQGFDVRLAVGTHGGCMRLLAPASSGIAKVADLRGKTVAVTDQASPVKNYFAIRLAKEGIDPDQVDWRQYPGDLFAEVVKKGEVQAAAIEDPHAWFLRERDGLTEIATNLDGDDAARTCCVLGIRGSLLRDEPAVAASLARAFIDAQHWTAANPAETAQIFAPFVPGNVRPEDVEAILRSHTHQHASTGAHLRAELAAFTEDLKLIRVIRPGTDAAEFAKVIAPDVLA